MFKYNEKTAFTYNIQSVVHCRKFSMKKKMGTLALQNSDELIHIWSLYTCSDFPGLSRTLSFNFQDFPGPKWFSRTFQVLEFSRKNPGLSRRRGNPENSSSTSTKIHDQKRCLLEYIRDHSTQIWSIRYFCWFSGGTKWPCSAAVLLRNHYSHS